MDLEIYNLKISDNIGRYAKVIVLNQSTALY